jgi:hypothetical protein
MYHIYNANTTKNMTEILLHDSIETEFEISVNKIKVKVK